MKKSLILAVALMASVAGQAQKIKGSDTLLPLMQKVAEEYMKDNKGASVTVTGGGSGVGLAALIDGSTDIATASRKIKFDEKLKLQQAGKAVVEKTVAFDALAVVVNPANKVSQLTRQQLEDIFTGKVKNWKEVGGADMPIVAYSRETSSGTYEFFKEHVMLNKNYKSDILSMPATGAIIQSVSQTAGAIGYVGIAYVNKSVKALAVSYDGKKFVAPSYATAKDKSYPVVRPLFVYYLKSDEAKVNGFNAYMIGAKGQALAKELGYIDIN